MAETAAPLQQSPAAPSANGQPATTPLCLVLDEEQSIRQFVSLVMHGAGIDTEEVADGETFRRQIAKRLPDLVILNVGIESADVIESMLVLSRRGYQGSVQLISNRGSAVLEHVRSVGEQNKLKMLPGLKKPFETTALLGIIKELNLGYLPVAAARVGLDEALRNKWVEFWYQPKIDLRRKQLAGVEAFARVRHPQHGVLPPEAFMPGASAADSMALAEAALTAALKAGQNFSKLGVNIRFAVNAPASALDKLPVGDLVNAHRGGRDWPGLIIDVSEEQIVTDLALAGEMAKKFEPLNVKLAIDNFGRGYSSLSGLKESPFAEFKLDRMFVNDCSSDKVNAPLCKTVIDLAHNFGSTAVAIGIEKASDAVALVSMGCDYGQGFLLGQPMPEDRLISLLRQRAASQGRTVGAARPAAAATR